MTASTSVQTETELGGWYPSGWDFFIGQDLAKRQLRVACASAKKRRAPLGHVLLASGEPGIGKTALALLAAHEMETRVKVVSGKVTHNEARILLAGMDDSDILLIDEAHRMVQGGKKDSEWLLHLLQDGVLMGPRGPEEQARITVIAATTDVARLPDTIVSRFPLQPVLETYTDEEAVLIGNIHALSLLSSDMPVIGDDTLANIARAANNNPRIIRMILSNLRDLAEVDFDSVYLGYEEWDISEALRWLGLTEDGLTEVACRYLITLMDEFGGQAGEKAMADRLQEAGLQTVERILMKKELIVKTRTGRVISKAGIKRAKELKRG